MKSVKIHTENSNEKKVLKETTIRKNLKKSDKVGKSRSHRNKLVKSKFFDKIGLSGKPACSGDEKIWPAS
jgi:hypothetical protein